MGWCCCLRTLRLTCTTAAVLLRKEVGRPSVRVTRKDDTMILYRYIAHPLFTVILRPMTVLVYNTRRDFIRFVRPRSFVEKRLVKM